MEPTPAPARPLLGRSSTVRCWSPNNFLEITGAPGFHPQHLTFPTGKEKDASKCPLSVSSSSSHSREENCKDKIVESWSALLPAARRLHHMANKLCSGLLWVEMCPLGESQPCVSRMATDLKMGSSHLISLSSQGGPRTFPGEGKSGV